jgi:hypothetical protein
VRLVYALSSLCVSWITSPWHSARWQNDLHSGESAGDLTEIEAEIILDATGNTSAIVRLLSPLGGAWRQAAARPWLGLPL